jgi:integrase
MDGRTMSEMSVYGTQVVRRPFPGPLAAARQAQQEALDSEDPWERANAMADIWLRSARFTEGTREQYAGIYQSWTEWCYATGITPLEAKRSDVNTYAEALRVVGNPAARKPRPLAKRTIARHLAGLSSYYIRAVDAEVAERNPVPLLDRPKIGRGKGSTRQPHLSREENRALLESADRAGARTSALVSLLLLACLRISEALGARIEDLTRQNGHDYLRVQRKGGDDASIMLAPEVAERVRAAIGTRRDGFIIATASGRPMDRKAAWRTVSTLGRAAGIPTQIGPHTLRHAYITRGHELGLPLADLQDAAGHASPITTRHYDRSSLGDRHPSLAIARDLAGPAPITAPRTLEET